jgi:hypothetical protein
MNRTRPTARRKGESEACSCSGFPSEEHYGDKLAAKSSEKLDWKHSIIDLMKLVGMESSLSARKRACTGFALQRRDERLRRHEHRLHKEGMQKLAANGTKVPQDLLNK